MFSKKNLEERRFWKSFLAVYKQYPEIWDPRCDKYSKREYKEIAYQALANKLQEIDPNASTDCVKRRLNIFKSNYKRELRRRTKTGIKGNLWYFDDLDFLIDIDKTRVKKSEVKLESNNFYMSHSHGQVTDPPVKNESVDIVDNGCMSSYSQSIPHSFQQIRSHFESADHNINLNEPPQQMEAPQSGFHGMTSVYQQSTESKTGTVSEQSQPEDSFNDDSCADEDFQESEDKIRLQSSLSQPSPQADDDADVYSRGWATTFRKIPANQQQLAKKLIDDILYEGYMGRLAEGKVQIVN